MFRVSHINRICLLAAIGCRLTVFGQADSLPYSLYNDQVVVYSDLGYNTAPIKLKYPFSPEIERLKLRNNLSATLGFGLSYKWFALRLGFTIPGNLRSESRYGKTNYFDLGFDFTLRRTFFDVDLHVYKGYAIKDAYRWNDTLDSEHPHEVRPDINSASFSMNAWVFQSKTFKMQAMRGKTGSYAKDVQTFYIKYSFNVYGIGGTNSIVPLALVDSTQSKTHATTLSAVDFALIPGYAYVKRWKQFQIGGLFGLGGAVQSKFYIFDNTTRGVLGLALRYDVKLIAGINEKRWFVMFETDFDNKSIRFNNFIYRQTYYSLKLVGGLRLDTKKRKKNVK